MIQHYILAPDGETPIAVGDWLTWAMWFEEAKRRVMLTHIGWPTYSYSYRISTVFLGLNHNFYQEGPPILWETMIFRLRQHEPRPSWQQRQKLRRRYDRPHDHFGFDQWQQRYSSLVEAVAGHMGAEARVWKALRDLRPTTVPPKFQPNVISGAAVRLMQGQLRVD